MRREVINGNQKTVFLTIDGREVILLIQVLVDGKWCTCFQRY